MLIEKIKNNFILMLILLVLIGFAFFFIIKPNESKPVAKAGDSYISYQELVDYLMDLNGKIAIDSLIDNSLFDQEFEVLNIPEVDDEIFIEQLRFIQLFNPQHKTLGDVTTKKFVEYYFKIKILAETYTINDTTLHRFLLREQEQNGDYFIDAVILSGTHEQLLKAENELRLGRRYDEIARELSLQIDYNQFFTANNEYGEDFSFLEVGQYLHIMSSNHIIDNTDQNNNANYHSIVIVNSINDVNDKLFNINENRELILNVYFSKNFSQERMNVSQYLRMKYEIEYY
ncbi:MAG: hypothetical protein FWG91_05330 [Lachnospiraceae bacterium]|nr:hypothetical protein [Lachnospiraceae bacterium]